MERIFITGANRGLGLEFTRRYLERSEQVFAACREPDKAAELDKLKTDHPGQLTILKMEVTNREEIDAAAKTVADAVDGLDLLINNAGIGQTSQFGSLEAEEIREVLEVNAIAPVIIAQAFAGLLRKGNSPKLVNISSGLGSIANTRGSGRYSYKASKAALNMLSRMMANEFKSDGIIVIPMHPGWVQTDMGGPNAHLTIPDSIERMLKVIDGLTIEDTGRFWDMDCNELPW
jgi:NAD(P)-dependent dehydrogenase (short-subunit alcohol dehydrogenase family)